MATETLTDAEAALNALYGSDTFGIKTMEKYLSKSAFKKMMLTVQKGGKLDTGIADEVAQAMKVWALSKGATHYTHWFQPLSDATAEKHDSFVEPDGKGGMICEFTGKNLIQAEPDASSFPSGGIRATFEARGYTAWDPTSPAFIKRTENTVTLCIPTAFCSYTGEALDKKTPLLRSMAAVAQQTMRVLRCFGIEPSYVVSNLGAEQEYFLIDRDLYLQRPDLIETGRTLFGCLPPKHQQMEDHYFGSIKERVLEFMMSVDRALWTLGVPAKTRHNEAAPGQFEICPLFEPCNVAVDHNVMIMDILQRQALKFNLVCLLHEKPYAHVNGSGKHNNWSLSTPELGSLFSPGKTPHSNLLFLTFLSAVLACVDKHADLLRASTSKAGNDHRLGAAEAPPAIISIFLGDQLTDIIEQIKAGGAKSSASKTTMELGVDVLPELPKDTTDRNRTSPFAFTGNKFEFRAVGSSQTCAWPMAVLNTIMTEALDEVATRLEPHAGTPDFKNVVRELIRDLVTKHDRIIFNGNGYSDEWVQEAEKRGLPHIKTTPEALEVLSRPDTIALMEKYGVLSRSELLARKEIQLESFEKLIDIEAKTCLNMLRTIYLPAIATQMTEICGTVGAIQAAGLTAGLKAATQKANEIGELYDALAPQVDALAAAIEAGEPFAMRAAMEQARNTVDALEAHVDAALWPVPTYAQMLNIHSR
ncbi:MAG: glutamine synthetase type III [Akkermansiaceae bacterium]|nr:glutamine synthetase type III [Akkermansiaceae bacterium]